MNEAMKNGRKILIWILIGTLALFDAAGWVALVGQARDFLFAENREEAKCGLSYYHKEDLLHEYGGDLGSYLMIFPDDKTMLKDCEFSYDLHIGLLDTDGYILLEARYDEAAYYLETVRLANLKLSIREERKDGMTAVQEVRRDPDSYAYPAFVTADGFGNTYEYALMDSENLRIIYVYLAYPDVNNEVYGGLLKKDTAEYALDEKPGAFSIYYHSFDGGKSYVMYSNEFGVRLR